MNRASSIRSKLSGGSSDKGSSSGSHKFHMSSLRGLRQPELSKKLYQLIKTQNGSISAYENAGKEGQVIANQLSEWGESTDDDALSDLSDKLGVLLAEIAEQEDLFAQNLEESRGVLKQIRNTEHSVAPTRTQKAKIQDEIQKLKYKEPDSPKLPILEQELVRAEAQSLVAEAQLTNITRQKFKEAYDVHTAAIIERAEKQIILAQQARRLLNILDDTPIVPGEERIPFAGDHEAKEVLNDAESGLKSWHANVEPIHFHSEGKLGANAMPGGHDTVEQPSEETLTAAQKNVEDRERAQEEGREEAVPAPVHTTEEKVVETA